MYRRSYLLRPPVNANRGKRKDPQGNNNTEQKSEVSSHLDVRSTTNTFTVLAHHVLVRVDVDDTSLKARRGDFSYRPSAWDCDCANGESK